MSVNLASLFRRPPLTGAAYRYLALGDSYTIGDSVEPADRWPAQLVRRLRGAGVAMEDPEYVADTALTVAELAQRLAQAGVRGPYDLVSLLVGVNNQYRRLAPEAYRTEFRNLLRSALAHAQGEPDRMIVLSIPDWGVTPFGIASGRAGVSAEIDLFNRIGREECLSAGICHVDVTPLSRERADDPLALAADGLHPSAHMYAAWVTLVIQQAWPALAGPSLAPPPRGRDADVRP